MLTHKQINRIFALFVFIFSTIIYLRTVAPTTSFWDCGEFIACSYILGVPHPPGAPLYILVGRLFSMIPFAADIGLRVNVLSSLASSFTIMFVYLIIIQLITMFRGLAKDTIDRIILYSSGVIGALFFAFTDTFWFNAVEAEVYSISILFTALVFWLILLWHEKADEPNSDKYILMIAYLIGLAISVHLLTILALPAVGLIIYFRKQKFDIGTFLIFGLIFSLAFITIYPGIVKWLPNLALKFHPIILILVPLALLFGAYYALQNKKRIAALACMAFLLILVANSTYTAIYIRSNLNPAIDENDPETLDKMVKYLNREQYGDWGYVERRAPLWEYQIKKMYLRYFGWQFIGTGTTLGEDRRVVENFSLNGLLGLPFLVGLIGMFYHFRKDRYHASVLLTLFFMTGITIVLYLNQEDPQPRERDYVYVGSYMAFAVWIGIGVSAILEWTRNITQKFPSVQKLALLAMICTLILALPVNTIALNYDSHDRTGNYVAYDYSYNILQSCEPNAILFTNGDNDTFPLWFLQNVYNIRQDVRVVNLSLLNTSWYILQLKHQEPKVPISLSDETIETLTPRLLPEDRRLVRIPVSREVFQQHMEEALVERKDMGAKLEDPPEISFELKPTLMGQALRVQDLMILNIIQANRFKHPVYFALTVSRQNQLNMFKYLRMDGLVFKLVTYPEEQVSAVNLQKNLFEKFQYRGLADSTVYFNENIKGLLRNYQGSFFSLAQYYAREKQYDKMIETFDKLDEVMPTSIIPIRDDLNYQIGYMYYQAGKEEEFKRRLENNLKTSEMPLEEQVRYATIFSQLFKDNEKAESIVNNVLSVNPDFAQAYYWLLSHYYSQQKFDEGITLLNRWIDRHPDDKTAQQQLDQFIQMAAGKTESDTAAVDSTVNN